MKNIITKVEKYSIAEEVGIEVNDSLISINQTPISDIMDYKFLSADEEIVLEIEKSNGEIWEIEIEKEYGEDIGLEFGGGLMDKAKRCSNKCIFCFIDQLPPGMRDTLYFKDDDSRLSFLQGNFVTLTNMKEEDIDRIIKYHISPINVSVHTTNPELRVKMLNNRFAGNILERLKRLTDAGITINSQVVCIPGINNGDELKRTIEDLYNFYPFVATVAVVPIGITKFREKLQHVKTFTKEQSKKEIEMVKELQNKFIKEVNEPFVRLSDEFYIVSGNEVPSSEFYKGYEQLEDGVGVVRYFKDIIDETLNDLDENSKGSFSIATGALAYEEIIKARDKILKKNPNIKLDVYKVINDYFGETITITGLLTGTDIINQLKGKINTKYLLMADCMFRKGYELADSSEQIMLDDLKIRDIEEALDVKVIVTDYTGENLISILNEYKEEF
ncbi:radical SAM protein [Clostridium botulinum]|uniref:radical SAM protein n=1 Tax=unclassified Clostridium TaxID=2614128 RepID=UPI000505786E|nr:MULTISPECIES: radical SAM protein [unclassified Clostridium]AIY82145.1 PDZ domain family protein [Clostridium botulinum 202F]KAI3348553.1 radical SAM protein [Clostridium botulinum]KFX58235.1 Fe-S oxidoreductase [Clostridium botulinum]KFX59128.1 Fe-S oxidoreductase [Clostridium botulinum]KON12627.1 Fe-S oxidoreductase [Clostridium botulinum]